MELYGTVWDQFRQLNVKNVEIKEISELHLN